MSITLTHQFPDELPELCVSATAAPAPHPQSVIVNTELADEIGIDAEWLQSDAGAAFLTGQGGDNIRQHPIAQRYSGHQFGGFSPLLGDGRAMLLGETRTADGETRDLHLKGSGPTPMSRGDGMATLEATLREFLVSEAMHALGIPTTRSLAVATTGRRIVRDDFRHDNVQPGAVLTRVAHSHVRIGTFQYARISADPGLLTRLLAHTVHRLDPDLAPLLDTDVPQAAETLLRRVIDRQAQLVAQWMLVGFVHGVMNTDNVLISGETIDYGPCAFIDAYDPRAVFSSIDHGARYAYGAQPRIMKWNLARLADALLPLLADDEPRAISIAEAALDTYDEAFSTAWERGMRAKLGLSPETEGGPSRTEMSDLTRDLFTIMERERLDFTTTFRTLAGAASEHEPTTLDPLADWLPVWRALRPDFFLMAATNPVTIPRNHHLQAALDEAVDGDLTEYTNLLEAVTDPYRERAAWARFAGAGAGGSAPFVTFCGT